MPTKNNESENLITDAFNNKVIDRMDQNQGIFNRLMDGGDFNALVSNVILKEVYHRLNSHAE